MCERQVSGRPKTEAEPTNERLEMTDFAPVRRWMGYVATVSIARAFRRRQAECRLGRRVVIAALALMVFPQAAVGELNARDISPAGASASAPSGASDGAGNVGAVGGGAG